MFERDNTDTTFLYELARDSETSEIVAYLKHSDDPVIRARAAEILGDFADAPRQFDEHELTRELVTAALEDDEERVRAMAIDALYRHGQESLEQLIDELSERDIDDAPDWVVAETLLEWLGADQPEFRLVAATALGDYGDEHVVPDLVERFDDPDARVRTRAIRSCGMIGDQRCVDAIAECLEDDRTMVRREAASALINIGTERALERLVPMTSDGDEQLRQIAVEGLGQFANLKPLIVLIRALDDPSPAVQRTATISLIELFANAPPEHASEIRSTVADQLERVESIEVVPPLLDVLEESTRWAIRRNAIWLLGQVADETHEDAVFDVLIDALDDEDTVSAQLATSALVSLAEDLDDRELEKRLRLYIQNEDGTETARNRAEYVADRIGPDVERELVTSSVEYTYVREPADYTRKKREEDS